MRLLPQMIDLWMTNGDHIFTMGHAWIPEDETFLCIRGAGGQLLTYPMRVIARFKFS